MVAWVCVCDFAPGVSCFCVGVAPVRSRGPKLAISCPSEAAFGTFKFHEFLLKATHGRKGIGFMKLHCTEICCESGCTCMCVFNFAPRVSMWCFCVGVAPVRSRTPKLAISCPPGAAFGTFKFHEFFLKAIHGRKGIDFVKLHCTETFCENGCMGMCV